MQSNEHRGRPKAILTTPFTTGLTAGCFATGQIGLATAAAATARFGLITGLTTAGQVRPAWSQQPI